MAARTHLGGLAEPTRAGVIVLAAAFDVVFVETVGVGQSEAEIVNVVDTLVFVAQPGAGDTIQFIKAGILEIPDIFAVNKADLGPLAERTRHELFASLGLAEPGDDGWKKPVILTAARDGRGVPEVAAAITEHRRHLESKDLLRERRRRGREANVVAALSERYGSFGIERLGGEEALRRRIAEGPDVRTFGDLINRLAQEIEAALMGSS
jgi:LAO/AO transport system kinase